MEHHSRAPTEHPVTKPTMVMIWAPSCADCRAMKPALIEAWKSFEDQVELNLVDASTSPAAARAMRAMATPTLIGFSGENEMFRLVGRRAAGELHDLFASLVSGSDAQPVGRQLRLLRGVTAAALVGLGLAAGPAWPLVIVGTSVAAWVIVDVVRSRR